MVLAIKRAVCSIRAGLTDSMTSLRDPWSGTRPCWSRQAILMVRRLARVSGRTNDANAAILGSAWTPRVASVTNSISNESALR